MSGNSFFFFFNLLCVCQVCGVPIKERCWSRSERQTGLQCSALRFSLRTHTLPGTGVYSNYNEWKICCMSYREGWKIRQIMHIKFELFHLLKWTVEKTTERKVTCIINSLCLCFLQMANETPLDVVRTKFPSSSVTQCLYVAPSVGQMANMLVRWSGGQMKLVWNVLILVG